MTMSLLVFLVSACLVQHIHSTDLGLKKHFKTAKEINFDSLELVERNGFESTTLAPAPSADDSGLTSTTPRGSHNNVANAQVLLRIGGGGGEASGSGFNHVMKIPPQCRHNNIMMNNPAPPHPHPHDLYYPPFSHRYPVTCHPQFYHPYPPPVPFAFPNYYFYDYGPGSNNLPPQLSEYFARQPNVIVKKFPGPEQVFIRGRRPIVRRRGEEEEGGLTNNATVADVQNSTTMIQVRKVIMIHPRGTDDLGNLTISETGAVAGEKATNATKSVKNQKDLKRKSKKVNPNKVQIEDQDLDMLENVLNEALKTYKKHHNETDNVTNTECPLVDDTNTTSLECQEVTTECPLDGSNSTNLECQDPQTTMDDLAMVVADYIIPEPEVYAPRLQFSPYGGSPRYIYVPDSGLYCSKCGYQAPAPPYCSKCGFRHSGGSYCDQCGYPVMVAPGGGRCPQCAADW